MGEISNQRNLASICLIIVLYVQSTGNRHHDMSHMGAIDMPPDCFFAWLLCRDTSKGLVIVDIILNRSSIEIHPNAMHDVTINLASSLHRVSNQDQIV